jgi:hypothetical protein
MTRNVGPEEGAGRAALGGLALGAGIARGNPWLLGLGLVGLGTAFSGYCPMNALLGIGTARGLGPARTGSSGAGASGEAARRQA